MDEGLQVHLELAGDVPVVRAVGEIDLATAPDLRDTLAEIPGDAGTEIVDLSEVTFIDSTGLSVLVATWKLFDESGAGGFRLVVSRPAVRRVLDVTGLAQVFTVFPTLEEALQR